MMHLLKSFLLSYFPSGQLQPQVIERGYISVADILAQIDIQSPGLKKLWQD